MVEKCQIAANDLASMKILNHNTVTSAVDQMGSLTATRLIITDHMGRLIYDSEGQPQGSYVLLPEIVQAMQGNNVFYCKYHDGTMQSHAATPIISSGNITGCVYMMEYDTAQGSLIRSLQYTVLEITLVLEVIVLLFSLAFSKRFSIRFTQIMASMRIIQQGDYTHKVSLGGHDELTFLGDEFNDLTERLQTSEQKRHRFVSDASHELKTPLASIKLLTDSILQNDMDMETVKEFVNDIGNEADRLNRMTTKLLSLTKADTQIPDESEIINMTPTITRVAKMLTAVASQNDITIRLELEENCPILILEDDLYQIVFNLVENGIKYNMPGGILTVKLNRVADNAVMKVIDTGVGIPEDALVHVFERFYRVDKARSRETGGSGLGLSIVKTIVVRNRGEITVSSIVDQGTTFTVTFPIFDTEEELS